MSVSRLLPALLVVACSSEPIPSGRYIITTGQESDVFTRSPVPVKFEVTQVDSNGNTTSLQASDKPIEAIDVGYTGSYSFQLQGTDADNQRRIQAMSYYAPAWSLAGQENTLFAGRTDVFCRPPENLTVALGDHPAVGMFWGQMMWITGTSANTSTVGEGYDFFSWKQVSQPTFISQTVCANSPCTFKSIANYGGQFGLAIGDNWAVGIDIQNQSITDVKVPSGLGTWSNVSGGRSLNSPSGAAFVVGSTRMDAASSQVLELAIDGNQYSHLLAVSRQGAAAVYLSDRGLVVSGGDASGTTTNPGVEFLAADGSDFVGIPYAADAVVGAALVPEVTGTRVWRIGGRNPDGSLAPTLVYDVACTNDCTPEAKPEFDLDVTNAQGFKFNQTRMVVGETSDGTMVAWRLTDDSPVPILLREPRRNATAYSLPNGFLALIGGTLLSDGATPATSLELVAY